MELQGILWRIETQQCSDQSNSMICDKYDLNLSRDCSQLSRRRNKKKRRGSKNQVKFNDKTEKVNRVRSPLVAERLSARRCNRVLLGGSMTLPRMCIARSLIKNGAVLITASSQAAVFLSPASWNELEVKVLGRLCMIVRTCTLI